MLCALSSPLFEHKGPTQMSPRQSVWNFAPTYSLKRKEKLWSPISPENSCSSIKYENVLFWADFPLLIFGNVSRQPPTFWTRQLIMGFPQKWLWQFFWNFAQCWTSINWEKWHSRTMQKILDHPKSTKCASWFLKHHFQLCLLREIKISVFQFHFINLSN